MKRRILSLSADPELGKLRAMVLEHAGYSVLWPSSKAEADRVLREKNFEALVIGHTISGPSSREFADIFRAKNPEGKIIVIMAASYGLVKADKTVRSIDGPEALLEAIEELFAA